MSTSERDHRSLPSLATAVIGLTLLPVMAIAPTATASNAPIVHGNKIVTAKKSTTRDWTATPAARASLKVTGPDRVKASVKRGRGLRLRHQSTVVEASATKRKWQVKVRSTRPGQTAQLRVTDASTGRRVASTTKRLKSGTWANVRVAAAIPAGAELRTKLVVPAAHHKVSFTVAGYRTTAKPVPADPDTTRPNTCATTARGLPQCGAFLGMAYGSNTDPTELEKGLGAPLGVRRTYYRADQVAGAVKTVKADVAAGRLPWISFKVPYSWEDMVAGKGDAWARDVHTQLDAVNGPVWVAFHHEPETDGNIQTWRKMQERLAPIVRGDSTNIGYSVVLTGWHQFYGPSEYSLANIWPRNVKIDVAGFDVYNTLGVVKNGKLNTKGNNMDTNYYAKIQAWAKTQKVAWGLAETGYTDYAAQRDPHWITTAHQQMVARGGVAFAYFNTTLNSIAPWRLDATKLAQYKKAVPNSATIRN